MSKPSFATLNRIKNFIFNSNSVMTTSNSNNNVPSTSNNANMENTNQPAAEAKKYPETTAYPVYAILNGGRIMNIAIGAHIKDDSQAHKTLSEVYERIGTIHAEVGTKLYTTVHKGFAGKDHPTGNQYGVSEKTKFIPYSEVELHKYRLLLFVKKDQFDVARDGNGRVIIDPVSKQPMLVEKSKVTFADVVPSEQKAVVDDYLKRGFAMPLTIISDKPFTLTFYRDKDRKVFIRPNQRYTEVIPQEVIDRKKEEYKRTRLKDNVQPEYATAETEVYNNPTRENTQGDDLPF